MVQLFVYGSLRKGMYNYEKYLKGKSTFIACGYVKGELYSLQGVTYPALLTGDEDILGEIYEVNEDVAKEIDELEGYHGHEFEDDYDKVVMEVHIPDQNMDMVLPVYMFNMKKEDNQKMLGERIHGNDYVMYRKMLQEGKPR